MYACLPEKQRVWQRLPVGGDRWGGRFWGVGLAWVVAAFLLAATPALGVGLGTGWLQPEHLAVLECAPPEEGTHFESANQPGNLFYSGESVSLKVQRVSRSNRVESVVLEVVEIGSQDNHDLGRRNEGGTALLPALQVLERGGGKSYPVTLSAEIGANNVVELQDVPVPARFGTYAILITPQGEERRFLCTVARIHRPSGGDVWNTPIFGDGQYLTADELDVEFLRERAEALRRMGIAGVRVQLGWCEPDPGRYDWQGHDRLMTAMSEAGLKAMVTLSGHPYWSMPFGEPTPSVRWSYPDLTCQPKYREVFGLFVYRFCSRYWQGGQGALWALEHWNEPWEGISIDGWQSDADHYRALMQELAENARRVDPRIRSAAAGSIVNTELKFLAGDHPEEQLKWVDIFTDHYAPPASSYGPVVAAQWGRESMDTEAWLGANEVLLGQVMMQWLASGQRRVTPWQAGMAAFSVPGAPMRFQMPTTIVPATAAFNAFVAGKRFEGLLFQTHLPYAFQFGFGEDSVVLLTGRLLPLGRPGAREPLWSQSNLEPGGEIVIHDPNRVLQVFDHCGNPAFGGEETVRVPADGRMVYLKAPQGGVEAIRKLLLAAQLQGFRPVEITTHDFTLEPDAPGAHVRLTLHNLLNRAMDGTLSVSAPEGMELEDDEHDLHLGIGERRDFQFGVRDLAANAANAYRLRARFESDAGTAVWEEDLHDVLVRRRRIDVDGKLDDWRRVPGIVLMPGPAGESLGFDVLRRDRTNVLLAEFKLAWDDRALYVAARVQDSTPDEPHVRLEDWDEEAYFWSAADDAACEALRPFESLLSKLPDDPNAWKPLSELPEWSGFLSLMATQDQARWLVGTRAAQVYFRAKRRDSGASFARASHVYKRLPWAARPYVGDTLQIGLDLMPGYEHHRLQPDEVRVPEGFQALPDTDYEYCFYACADGGTEVWRCLAPGVPRSPWAPRQLHAQMDQGPVRAAECIVVRTGSLLQYEAAIPWREFADWQPRAGAALGLTFRINDGGGVPLTFGQGKSATRANSLSLHPYHEASPSCGVRWVLGK